MFMSKTSAIPNKRPITLTVDKHLAAEAKKKGVNISLVLDAALNKELNSFSNDAFLRAVEKQNEVMKKFLKEAKLEERYDDWKYGGAKDVAVEKKQENTRRSFRQTIGDAEASGC